MQQQKPVVSGSQDATQYPLNNTQQQTTIRFGRDIQPDFQPWEIMWSPPPSSTRASGSNALQKVANRPLGPKHKCTDAASCIRQMKEDFEYERPLWKLTCYGHVEYGPCDIEGDTSYEELRAFAYEEAKRGLFLEPIVQRETSSLVFKVLQFNGIVTYEKTWLKLNAAIKAANSSVSRAVTVASESKGSFGSQFPIQPLEGSLSSVAENNSTTGTVAELNTFHTSQIMPPVTNLENSQSSVFPNGLNAASFEMTGSNASQDLIVEMPKGDAGGCNSIWFKEEWFPGEIPEAAPPDEFMR